MLEMINTFIFNGPIKISQVLSISLHGHVHSTFSIICYKNFQAIYTSWWSQSQSCLSSCILPLSFKFPCTHMHSYFAETFKKVRRLRWETRKKKNTGICQFFFWSKANLQKMFICWNEQILLLLHCRCS